MSKDNPKNSPGFKPQVARDILGVTKERFRYWRTKLDPNPFRSHLSFMDIMVYRVFKSMVDNKSAQVEDISGFDFSELFSLFNKSNYKDLRKICIALDTADFRFYIAKSREELVQYMRNSVRFVYMDELVDEQIQAITEYGSDFNVVSINPHQIAK